MPSQSKSTLNIIVDVLLVFAITLGIILTYIFISANLAFSLSTLVGVWYIDGYLKKSFEYPNETLFADLSFASLIFFIGQKSVGELLVLPEKSGSLSNLEYQVLPIAIGLCILWLGNLRLCRGLVYPRRYLNSLNHIPYVWFLSFFFAISSTSLALLPQILNLLK
jgi:hypothetical protein